MPLDHYTADELAAARATHPGHFIVEVATPHAACLIAILDTPAHRTCAIATLPGMSADLLDGNTIFSKGASA